MLTNPEVIPRSHLIIVNGVVATYLMNEKKVPLLGKNSYKSEFYFMKTSEVELFLKEMPFYLKLSKYVF